jgi:hypothetical protein
MCVPQANSYDAAGSGKWKSVIAFYGNVLYGPQSLCAETFPDKCSDQAPDGAKVQNETL